MVEIIGIENVRRSLERLNGEVEHIVKREVLSTTLKVQNDAKQHCPIRTRRLRNSITHNILDGGFTGVVGTNVHYAPYVELGTRHMNARPFLFPAWERHVGGGRFRERLRVAVRRAARAA